VKREILLRPEEVRKREVEAREIEIVAAPWLDLEEPGPGGRREPREREDMRKP
jgi:hypothetical protein